MRSALSSRWRLGALELSEDRELAGQIAGLLYLAGAAGAVLMLVLPGVPHSHGWLVLVMAGVGLVWGIACLTVVPWPTAPRFVSHVSSSAGYVITAAMVALLGGAQSPARFLVLFIAFYAAYFYPPATAALYLAGCCVLYALPLVYDASSALLAEMTFMVPTIVLLGGGVAAGKGRLLELRAAAEAANARHQGLAAEQAALRRVATAAASESSPQDIYALASMEAARLLDADVAGVLRFDSPEQLTVVGAHGKDGRPTYALDTVVPTAGTGLDELWRTGEAVLLGDMGDGDPDQTLGYRCSVLAPITGGAGLWGVLAIASVESDRFDQGTVGRLAGFAQLLATAVAKMEDRQRLLEMASTDPLTALANHRTFHDRLVAEVSRAQRHGRPLALAVIDLDQFKQINDTAGHGAGDAVLAAFAEELRQSARPEDLLARVGGDEFAILLPETTSLDALAMIERVRARIAGRPLGGHRVTASAGICDLGHASTPDELFRYADGALYWSKAHGRDSAWVFDPAVVRALSAQERAEHLERSQALSALRVLARAIDAKDPATRQHSERVADLAGSLADVRGWSPERIERLREAALVHDVGKIGVRDAVLLKNGRLDPAEYEEVKQHALLGAQIVAEVLDDEQVTWIRGHHERPDGGGYPDALVSEHISEGAALLALADAFDVMTISRSYSAPRSLDEALAECQSLAGAQFSHAAVDALTELASRSESGLIALPAPR